MQTAQLRHDCSQSVTGFAFACLYMLAVSCAGSLVQACPLQPHHKPRQQQHVWQAHLLPHSQHHDLPSRLGPM